MQHSKRKHSTRKHTYTLPQFILPRPYGHDPLFFCFFCFFEEVGDFSGGIMRHRMRLKNGMGAHGAAVFHPPRHAIQHRWWDYSSPSPVFTLKKGADLEIKG